MQNLEALRHSVSHVMAQAVKRLYPDAKLAIGPAIKDGFYYDFDLQDGKITADNFPEIEKEMQKIINEKLPIERHEVTRSEAVKLMKDRKETYKLELIDDISENEKITVYTQGEFTDICAGPHIENTGNIKAFKLISATGAYWRGSEKNKMLLRIYGTAFESKKELEEHLNRLEEAKKRDHNKIGRELEIFTTVDMIGQGLPILLPKGAKIIQIMQRFVEDEEEKRGYLLTKTPFLAKSDLYKISGHWQHYKDGMFILGDEKKDKEVFALRPMTCPFQFQAYLTKTRSYRDLPLRYNETSTLFRNEASGEMHGLIRVRQFTISEGHIACTSEQLESEFNECLDLVKYMLNALGVENDVSYRFSKWDENKKEKYIGSPDEWNTVQKTMKDILDKLKLSYTEAEGDAAFYGPKLDIQMKNVFGKEDTVITIQIDFQLAKVFGMEFVDSDGTKKYPYILHRTSIGCYERMLAMLIEKYAGALPLWLSPEQVRVLTVTEKNNGYADEITKVLKENNFRASSDIRNEKISYKIREAISEKIPYLIIIGENEENNKSISVRGRGNENISDIKLADFIIRLLNEIKAKK